MNESTNTTNSTYSIPARTTYVVKARKVKASPTCPVCGEDWGGWVCEDCDAEHPEGVRVGGHDVPQSVVDEMALTGYGCPQYDSADWIAGRNRLHALAGERLAHTNGSTFTWESDYGIRWIVSAFDNSDTMFAPNGQRSNVSYFVNYNFI